jgi:hypothetical protein
MPKFDDDPIADERATATNDIIKVILTRLQRGEPVTKDVLDRIPSGMRVEMPLTLHGEGGTQSKRGVLIIENSVVKFYPEGERPN